MGSNHFSSFSQVTRILSLFMYRMRRKLVFLPRAMVYVLLLTFVGHRTFSAWMQHIVYVNAPITTVERDCPAPSYKTLLQSGGNDGDAKMKICLTTLTDERDKALTTKMIGWRNFDGLLALTWQNKADYAAKHGYYLFDQSHLLDKTRPPSWSKIRAVQDLIENHNCTWVFWLDADTVIMNSNKRVQEFLPAPENQHSLLLSQDSGGGYNAGVWLVRNSEWGRNFLQTWWDMKSYVKPPGLSHSGDNDALKAYMRDLEEKGIFDKDVLAPPRCTFNSFAKFLVARKAGDHKAHPEENEWYMNESYYHKGDFIAHVAGVDNKVETIKLLLELAQ